MPAWKIPPKASQLVSKKVLAKKSETSSKEFFVFF